MRRARSRRSHGMDMLRSSLVTRHRQDEPHPFAFQRDREGYHGRTRRQTHGSRHRRLCLSERIDSKWWWC